jgi:hypothetical protein
MACGLRGVRRTGKNPAASAEKRGYRQLRGELADNATFKEYQLFLLKLLFRSGQDFPAISTWVPSGYAIEVEVRKGGPLLWRFIWSEARLKTNTTLDETAIGVLGKLIRS